MSLPLHDFRRWMERADPPYRPSTVDHYARIVATLQAAGNHDLSGYRRGTAQSYRYAWNLYRNYEKRAGRSDPGELIMPERAPGGRGAGRRRGVPQGWDEQVWETLLYAAREDRDDATGKALACVLATGLRIGDVLRLERAELTALRAAGHDDVAGLRYIGKGGREHIYPLDPGQREDLDALGEELIVRSRHPNVAALVTGGDPNSLAAGAAYQRVRTRLLELAVKHGVQGHVYLHRARHTIALRVYDRTHDETAVMAILAHENLETTRRYLRSFRGAVAAAAVGVPRRRR